MNEKGLKTGAVLAEDNDEILGVNDRVQLEHLTTVLKRKINTYHMRNGVSIEDMDNTYIYDDVKIGKDTVIYPNTVIRNGVTVGRNCEIGPNVCIKNTAVIEDGKVVDVNC